MQPERQQQPHPTSPSASASGERWVHERALPPTLEELRRSTLQRLLTVTAIVAVVAYVPGVVAAWSAGYASIVVVDTLMWLLVVGLAVGRRLPFAFRAVTLVAAWFAFSLALVWLVGPDGAGTVWWLAVPVLAGLLLGVPGAVAVIAATVVVVLAVGAGLIAEARGGTAWMPMPGYEALSWFASTGSLVAIAVVLSALAIRLMNGLAASNASLRVANDNLRSEVDERERLERALLRGAEVRAQASLAGVVANDLNNLLVPMLSLGSDARDGTAPGSPERRRLDLVVASAKRARDLAGRMRSLSRDDAPDRRPVSVSAIARGVVALARAEAPATVRWELEADADDPHVIATPGEVHRVLSHLCRNAARAMEGRSGTVVTRVRGAGTPGEVVVEVIDQGVGIAPEEQLRVFEPSFGRGPGGASGLGLAIVRYVTQGLGGSVALSSTPNVGTTVTLRLPRTAKAPSEVRDGAIGPSLTDSWHDAMETAASTRGVAQVEAAKASGARRVAAKPPGGAVAHLDGAPTARSLSVLVVDDDELVRETIGLTLSSLGYAVRLATQPSEALAWLAEDPAAVDLVMTGLVMPGLSGLEVVERVRALRSDLPIVLVSSLLNEATRRHARSLGVDAVLPKPFGREALESAVDAALARTAG